MRDAAENFDFLVLPGLSNSGINHWQSYWCLAFRNATRVLQDDWDGPTLSKWLERLEIAIADGARPTVLICHSLSCSLAAHWAKRNRPGRVAAASTLICRSTCRACAILRRCPWRSFRCLRWWW